MKLLIKSLFILFFAWQALFAHGQKAQEALVSPGQRPGSRLQNQEKQLKKGRIDLQDTLSLPFFDDFSSITGWPGYNWWDGEPDYHYWVDRQVNVNNGYAWEPLSIGVATFDTYDYDGSFYQNASTGTFGADTLTSKYIDLDHPVSDSIYFSFFYQPGGLGDAPEPNDSLVVQFWSPIDTTWYPVHRIKGGPNQAFRPVIIPVNQEKFLQAGFRFRFIGHASLSKALELSLVANADHWHIDYVYLNKNRNHQDTVMNDVAFTRAAHSLIKTYTSVPWKHFQKTERNEHIQEAIQLTFKNHTADTIGVERYIKIIDSLGNGLPYEFEGGKNNIYAFENKEERYPFKKFSFESTTKDSAIFRTKIWLIPDNPVPDKLKKPLRWNDTVYYHQRFYDYYAYDDGTPEMGYGLVGQGTEHASIAMQFVTYGPDTIRGINIYFNKPYKDALAPDGNQVHFKPALWENANGKPGALVYANTYEKPAYPESNNGFARYEFDSVMIVSDTFYVGLLQTRNKMLNIGFDKSVTEKYYDNNDSINRNPYLHYNIYGKWENSSFIGAPMIRPFFGKKKNKPLDIERKPHAGTEIQLYPNPANDRLHVNILEAMPGEYTIQVFSITGQTLITRTTWQQNMVIDLSSLQGGIYIMQVTGQNWKSTGKFLVKD